MAIVGFDLGGTKLAMAVFGEDDKLLFKDKVELQSLSGVAFGPFIGDRIQALKEIQGYPIDAIGIAVPGIYNHVSGTVWAPNIEGWTDYPLLSELKSVVGNIPVKIDSDRSACILGEFWKGNAKGCSDAIFITVGTGIGAGILAGGHVLRGANDIAGAIGWMAVDSAYEASYQNFGCLETYASGNGMARLAHKLMQEEPTYNGILCRSSKEGSLTAEDVFKAYNAGDLLAVKVLSKCITAWGMVTANLISLLNPEKIIFGGGVFGPALDFLDKIKAEADRWAQPVSRTKVCLLPSALGADACLYGAAYMAKQSLLSLNPQENVS